MALVALGCRVNRADLDALAAHLGERFEVVGEREPADFVVVNTCAITSDADSAARQTVRRAARQNPEARIVAAGCYAQVCPEALASIPKVAAVIGVRAQNVVAEMLFRLAEGDGAEAAIAGAAGAVPQWAPAGLETFGHTRPFMKVQDGCDAGCSYCIVPLARGVSRSMPFDEAADRLVALGARHAEVVLTGVHLGAYGRDLERARTLGDLVRASVAQGFAGRLRLSSIEPLEFPVDLLLDEGTSRVLCEHFHLPLQSGSGRVLGAMRRPCRPDDYRRVMERIAALVPGACLGADVMVGFPGETDEDHDQTVALVKSLPLSYLHVFSFSPRPGTPAASMPEQPHGSVARDRARELLALSERKWRGFLQAQTGRKLEVVVERVEDGLARGTSRQYATVRWPALPGDRRGALARVRVESSDGRECFGIRATAFSERLPP